MYEKKKNGIIVSGINQRLEITLVNEKVARVQRTSHSAEMLQKSYMIEKLNICDQSVGIREVEGDIVLEKSQLSIRISKRDLSLTFSERNGRDILTETGEYGCKLTPKAQFKVEGATQFYGLGQHQKGVVGYKGTKVEIKHDNTTIAIPFLLTNSGYGLLWDNSGRVWADFTGRDSMVLESETGEAIDYYVILGSGMEEIIEGYWKLTGPAPMIPKYAFGFWQSKMRYMTQQELLDVAEKYRQKQYPVDILVVDFYHWTQMGDMQFDPEAWPDPEGMFKRLKELNIQGMVSVWPYISDKSVNYAPMEEEGILVVDDNGKTIKFTIFNGEKSGLYDPFNEKARRFIWNKSKAYYDQGAKIWWLDSCEPDDGLNIDDFRPTGIHTIDGPLDDRINAYALMHEKAFYEGQRTFDPDQRVLILARAAFGGCQRYGVTVWSGDVGYDFKALKSQITAGLNATMSGLPFWTTDIGGFQGGDPKDSAYKEVYIRWFQYGAFCPLFRVHGSRGATCFEDLLYGISRGENELWSFGEELEQIMVQYDRLRYRMMPYIYSCARRTIETGTPMMRALVIDYAQDKRAAAVIDQFMFGPSLMVCPVTEAGAVSREVYLPEGCDWYDFWNDRKYSGGQTIEAAAPIDRIPLFVKAGSIIPMGPEMQFAGESKTPPITLKVYSGRDGEFELYNDDGCTYAYEKGEFCLVKLRWSERDRVMQEEDLGHNVEEYFQHPFTVEVIG